MVKSPVDRSSAQPIVDHRNDESLRSTGRRSLLLLFDPRGTLVHQELMYRRFADPILCAAGQSGHQEISVNVVGPCTIRPRRDEQQENERFFWAARPAPSGAGTSSGISRVHSGTTPLVQLTPLPNALLVARFGLA
jgi:hypothetical protein